MTEFTIEMQCAGTAGDAPDVQQFRCWVASALRGRRRRAEVSIRVVDEDEMRSLNRRFRGVDRVTNVLAFPACLPEDAPTPLLGDLVLCAPRVRNEAGEQGKSLPAHWAHLTIHGALHLLGYDHVESEMARQMEDLEVGLLARLGFPDPYAAPAGCAHTRRSGTLSHG